MALPLAGSDPTVAGFNEWLTEVSQLHLDSKAWDGTVPWLSVHWMMYYTARLTPEQALISASARQTTKDAKEHIARARQLRAQLNADRAQISLSEQA